MDHRDVITTFSTAFYSLSLLSPCLSPLSYSLTQDCDGFFRSVRMSIISSHVYTEQVGRWADLVEEVYTWLSVRCLSELPGVKAGCWVREITDPR